MPFFRKYIGFLLWVLIFSNILAQNYDLEDQILSQLNYKSGSTVGAGNRVLVSQFGNENEAYLKQLASRQYAIIQQVGAENLIKAIQSGNSQIIEIYQNGDLNAVESLLKGNNLSSTISQYGANNSLQQIVTANNKSIEVTQVGNANKLDHMDTGSTFKSYTITQVGTGMNLRVKMGNVNAE